MILEPTEKQRTVSGLVMTVNCVGMNFVRLPLGSYLAGSPPQEEGRDANEALHQVIISAAVEMQTTPVTQAQWQQVMETNPSYFQGDPGLPVEQVSWNDCQEFIRRLNALEQTTAYRLPDETEWEYACRAGSTTAYCFGDDPEGLDDYGWHYTNADLRTQPVGRKLPNAWGLHDMHGNVWEWCRNWYHKEPSPEWDKAVEPAGGINKVVRGGAWYFHRSDCRSACRNFYQPGRREFFIGLRLIKDA